jgi:hypothetical protein
MFAFNMARWINKSSLIRDLSFGTVAPPFEKNCSMNAFETGIEDSFKNKVNKLGSSFLWSCQNEVLELRETLLILLTKSSSSLVSFSFLFKILNVKIYDQTK